MPYSLDITLTEFKYVTVTAKLCDGSASLKTPYVTAVPVYSAAVQFQEYPNQKLYENGVSKALVLYGVNEQVRSETFVPRLMPGQGLVNDLYLSAMPPQLIPVSPDGMNAVFSLPFGAQSKSYNNAANPSKYLVTLFNEGAPDSSGVTNPAVLAQGYLVLPAAADSGGGGGGGGGTPSVCSVTVA
jgi:hypothetical protein